MKVRHGPCHPTPVKSSLDIRKGILVFLSLRVGNKITGAGTHPISEIRYSIIAQLGIVPITLSQYFQGFF